MQLRAYTRPHQDEHPGLWRLPRNPFAEYGVDTIDAEFPTHDTDASEARISGDEDWLSTLHNQHDTTDTDG
jgi:hypothetical protein